MSRSARRDAEPVLARYELTERERARLRAIVLQRGLGTNITLYWANRMTPIIHLLPRTSALLGRAQLLAELDLYWSGYRGYDIQFLSETAGFIAFIETRIADGALPADPLLDVLREEAAAVEARYAEV